MTAWVLTIVSWSLLAIIWKRSKPKFLWWIKPILAFVGAAAFAITNWGTTIAGWAGGFLGWLAGFFGTSGGVAAAVLVLVLVVIVLLDIGADRVANGPALGALLVLPLLFIIAAGPIAQSGQELSDRVANAGATGVSRLVGGG